MSHRQDDSNHELPFPSTFIGRLEKFMFVVLRINTSKQIDIDKFDNVNETSISSDWEGVVRQKEKVV